MPKRIMQAEEVEDNSNDCLIIDDQSNHSAEKMKKLEKRMTAQLGTTKFPLKFTTAAAAAAGTSARRIDTTMMTLDTQPQEDDDETMSLPDGNANGDDEVKEVEVVEDDKSDETKIKKAQVDEDKKKQARGEEGKSGKKKSTQKLIQGKQFSCFVSS